MELANDLPSLPGCILNSFVVVRLSFVYPVNNVDELMQKKNCACNGVTSYISFAQVQFNLVCIFASRASIH